MDYKEFLKNKQKKLNDFGFDVSESKLNKKLFDFQKFIVRIALKRGKFGIFADCGLGKTFMQLEWAEKVSKETGGNVLILAPLAVTEQTISEADKFGIKIHNYDKGILPKFKIYITNYEQLEHINASDFVGIVLDESSIIKNFEGAIRNKLIQDFQHTKYKLCCTATPSPNDPMELGNHSEFLNVMSRNEMLSMYFVHDGGDTAKWRLKGHAINEFWKFVSQWAIMITKPSDIGFKNTGYDLPELNIIEYKIATKKKDNGMLFNDIAVNATNFNQELRETIEERLNKVIELVRKSKDNFIIWIKQNAEGEYLKSRLKEAIEVRGNDTHEVKKKYLLGFAKNEFRILITKPKIAQFGMNYQNCHNQIFASLDFSFESLYQSIRRSYRFGQKDKVNIHLVTTDTMGNVLESIKKKQQYFNEMNLQMSKSIISQYGKF